MRFFLCLLMCICSGAALAYTEAEFQAFLKQAEQRAVSQGVSRIVASETLATAQYLPKAIELDRKQPESRISFARYKENILTSDRINQGRAMMRQHKALLERISKQYRVQPQYIVALWGIETNYGGYKGNWGVISALATLAYEGRRAEFFMQELINALQIIDEKHISLDQFRGSWAGALGHNQFMPSSFLRLAVDGNQDGRKDIWNDLEDVFASTANYLSSEGWRGDERWGRRVKLTRPLPDSLYGRENKHSLSFWRQNGVTLPDGSALPQANLNAALVKPDADSDESYIIYGNYDVLMKWNRSLYFATTVGILADAIAVY